METKPYCVYNRTNESFLSLGVILDGGLKPWVDELLRKTIRAGSEGRWFKRCGGFHTLAMFESRDLIYLDGMLNVISTRERLPALRLAPICEEATSILELPAGSIGSTLTRVGHQLEICAAKEMEFRLRSMPKVRTDAASDNLHGNVRRDRHGEARRFSRRVRWPRLVAYDAEGTSMKVHGVRDIGIGGLYLLTEERWPVGAHIRMRLHRADASDEDSLLPVIVDLQVARWGEDGMGLEFLQITAEQTAILTMHVL